MIKQPAEPSHSQLSSDTASPNRDAGASASRLRTNSFRATILLASCAFAALAANAVAQDVTTWHNDNSRTGVQPSETVLTPANVNAGSFGKTFSLPVLGDVYAQPLYLKQYPMPDGLLHNVLIVATQQDYVYAFDADGNNPAQGYLWRRSLLGSAETWLSNSDVHTDDITPNIGITGTPVIDRAGGTIYVVAKSKTASAPTTYFQRIHALNIADGAEKLSGPTNIQATVPGTGDGGSTVSFSPLLNNQRPALLLAPTPNVGSGRSVVIAWSSHGDNGHYHGWVIAYDAANLSRQTGSYTDTPNGSQGGIWMSAGGPSADTNGNIFMADGNGTFDANTGGKDFGDSAFKLSFSASGLAQTDSFTPGDQSNLNAVDNDMGTSAMLLLPPQAGAVPNLAVTADKSGTIYLINRDNMGGYGTPGDISRQNFENGGRHIHSSFAFFNNGLYEAGDGGPLRAWSFNTSTELFNTTPQSSTSESYGCDGCDGGGSTPSISANGSANGIVWALDNSQYGAGPAILHAHDPANLATEFYNSSQAAGNRDQAASAVKFSTPTIANGRVYVGGSNAITVYGQIGVSTPVQVAAAPVFSPAAGTFSTPQTVSITTSTPGASIYYTLNNGTSTSGATLYTAPLSVSATETIQAYATASGFTQSPTSSATYTIQTSIATPVFSLPAGTYSAAQSVRITDATSGSTIFYTTNGSTPTTASAKYTGAIALTSTTTINAIAVTSGSQKSSVATATYVIGSSTQTQVSIAGVANTPGFYNDGITFTNGLDGGSYALSANLLGGSLTLSGTTYTFGVANQNNTVKGQNAPVIPLPAGTYTSLNFLGTAIGGNQPGQVFTIVYTDGSSTTFTQGISDWFTPQRYPGESVAVATAYRNQNNGSRDNRTFNVYQYQVPVDGTKTVKSLRLPNNANVAVLAVTMAARQVPVSLASSANAVGVSADGYSAPAVGLDGAGAYAYSANQLGPQLTYNGLTYVFGAANQNNVVKGNGAPVIALPAQSFTSLQMLATGVLGNQSAQVFQVTYTDGTVDSFTQSLSDWAAALHYPGESVAAVTTHRNTSAGGSDAHNFNVYQYSFAVNGSKTVKSLTLPNNPNIAILAITASSTH